MLSIELLTNDAEIERLLPDWSALWLRDTAATPFQWPDWLLTWWRHFGTATPAVVTARCGEKLVGVLPLYILDDSGLRKLLPIGVGLSDYLDALVDDGVEGVIEALFAEAFQIAGWQEFYFPGLRPGAALLSPRCPPGIVETCNEEVCPVLPLAATTGPQRAIFPGKKRQNLRRAWAQTELVGRALFTAADATNLETVMRELFRFQQERWRNRSQSCADPLACAFHLDAARRLLAAGMLRLYALWLDRVIVAVCYGFLAKNLGYAYMSGFDRRFEKLSVGTQLMAYAMESAMREGAREFHLLRGEEAYKYTWGAVARLNTSRSFRRC
ncbi:MAG: GNAT family N-acetyltransferase [Alphaproteobacteria bacterium]|nr:GNAT family N-acetyltransferase [Alphaproteobacteria bacterium]